MEIRVDFFIKNKILKRAIIKNGLGQTHEIYFLFFSYADFQFPISNVLLSSIKTIAKGKNKKFEDSTLAMVNF